MFTCFYKQLTGYDCPGCGIQRSAEALINGDILKSLCLYPALLPALGFFTFAAVVFFKPFKYSGTLLNIYALIVFLLIMLKWILF